jgi:hypothetical protein
VGETPIVARALAAYVVGQVVERHRSLYDAIRRTTPSRAASGIVAGVIAPFVAAAASLLRGLDRGRGIYLSMSWFAVGIIVPTSASSGPLNTDQRVALQEHLEGSLARQ